LKKTEKIEVRLSHEEKTALTKLAEQEGRSVSDLVRGLIERYMAINTTRLPSKTPWMKFIGIAVCGFFAGHLATYLIAKSHDHPSVYSLKVSVDYEGITVPLVKQAEQTDKFLMPRPDGDVLVKTKVTQAPNSLAVLDIELCRKINTGCEVIATPNLKFDPERIAGLSFKDEKGKPVSIALIPPKRDKD
jgi:hypothetical protein